MRLIGRKSDNKLEPGTLGTSTKKEEFSPFGNFPVKKKAEKTSNKSSLRIDHACL